MINHNYDLNNDLKLGSKSLLLKYLERRFSEVDYLDETNTINSLLNIISELYSDTVVQFNNLDIALYPSILEINNKSILKLIELFILKEDLKTNYYVFDYHEIIILQLDIINKIGEMTKDKNILCLLEVPVLSKEIIQKVNECKNITKIIIQTNHIEECEKEPNNIIILKKQVIDLANEEDIYELTLHNEQNYSIEELKNIILNNINKEHLIKDVDLYKLTQKT